MKLIIQAGFAIHRFLWGLLLVLLTEPGVFSQISDIRLASQGALAESGAMVLRSNGVASVLNSTNTSYILSVNDLIRVEVYKEDDLRRETRVDQDGTVSLPLIQTVGVGGRTIAEARELIRRLYEKDYLVSADVSITLVASSRTNKAVEVKAKLLKFTVSGEVKKPGIVEIPEGEKVNLVEAILQAGDFTSLANKRSVSIMRIEKGVQKLYREDVQSMLNDPKSKRFEILPGDVISVKQTIF